MTEEHPEHLIEHSDHPWVVAARSALDNTVPGDSGESGLFIDAMAMHTRAYESTCPDCDKMHHHVMIGIAGTLTDLSNEDEVEGAVSWFTIRDDEVDAFCEALQLTKATMGLNHAEDADG